MTTALLQMLVFLASAFGFAWYVLRIDKRENPPQTKRVDAQQKIDFPDPSPETNEHRGAAMSHF
jgi:hypothetical protein